MREHEGSSPSGSTNWNEAQAQHSDADGQSQDGSLGSLCGRGGTADTLDLGSSAARCKGSNPFARTIFKAHTANLLLEEYGFKSHRMRRSSIFGGMVYAID